MNPSREELIASGLEAARQGLAEAEQRLAFTKRRIRLWSGLGVLSNLAGAAILIQRNEEWLVLGGLLILAGVICSVMIYFAGFMRQRIRTQDSLKKWRWLVHKYEQLHRGWETPNLEQTLAELAATHKSLRT